MDRKKESKELVMLGRFSCMCQVSILRITSPSGCIQFYTVDSDGQVASPRQGATRGWRLG